MSINIDRFVNNLMNKKIIGLYIGFSKMFEDIYVNTIEDTLFSLKFMLGFGRYPLHAKAFLKLEGEDTYGILAEYGKKDYNPENEDRNSDRFDRHYYIYGSEGGLRYYITSLSQFKENINDYMKLIIDLEQSLTTNQLLNHACRLGTWNQKEYNPLTHNCQNFVATIVKILKAIRKIECKHDGRGYHYYSISCFPPSIIKELEQNENDQSLQFNKNFIGKIDEGLRIIGDFFSN